MFQSKGAGFARKRTASKVRARGKSRGARGGSFQAGYEQARKDMQARLSGRRGRRQAAAGGPEVEPSYGQDDPGFQRRPPRIGYRI